MKVVFISADNPTGIFADWPAVPSSGDFIVLHHHLYNVELVRWLVADDHTVGVVEVHLSGFSAAYDDAAEEALEMSH